MSGVYNSSNYESLVSGIAQLNIRAPRHVLGSFNADPKYIGSQLPRPKAPASPYACENDCPNQYYASSLPAISPFNDKQFFD